MPSIDCLHAIECHTYNLFCMKVYSLHLCNQTMRRLTSGSCRVQDPEGHSLWDLTWYKAHSISANLTPSLLAESGLVPSPLPTVPENDTEQPSAAQDQPVLPTVPEDDAGLPSGSREDSSLDAVPEHQPEPPSASASSEAGWQLPLAFLRLTVLQRAVSSWTLVRCMP